MADAELDRWRKYQEEKKQRDKLIAAEKLAVEQAAAEAQAAEQRRLAAKANERQLLEAQRAAERAARDEMPAFDMMAQSNEMAAFEAGSRNIAPAAVWRGMGAAEDPDEAGEARYNACSAALSEALPDP